MTPRITKPIDIYVRVSRVGGREGDSFISPKVQEERCRALATARGYEVGLVFTDLDQSGGTMDRPEFNKALARIKSGEAGGIIVARIDRFSRSLQGALNTIQVIQQAGGFLIECDGDWDTSTSMGRFGRDLVLRISQLFREQIAESWEIARREAVGRGVHVSAAPAGYRKRQDGVLEPSEHAPAIRRVFEMRAQGASQSEIGRYLLSEGVPTMWSHRAASSWSIRAVQLLLQNRVYLGEARSGAYVKEDAHKAIVTRGLFRAVQDRRGKIRAASTNGREGPLLGGGLLRCATCGCRLSRDTTKARGKVYRFYRCKSNPACPSKVSISATQIEPYLEGIVLRFLANARYEPEQQGNAELDGLRTAVEDARAYQAELDEAVAAGQRIAPSTLSAAAAAVDAARDALDAAESQTAAPVRFPTSAEAWDALSVPEKRRIITALIGTVVVRKGKGQGVADRIERCDAPEDWPEPPYAEDALTARLTQRFADLYSQAARAGDLLP